MYTYVHYQISTRPVSKDVQLPGSKHLPWAKVYKLGSASIRIQAYPPHPIFRHVARARLRRDHRTLGGVICRQVSLPVFKLVRLHFRSGRKEEGRTMYSQNLELVNDIMAW